VHKDQRAPAAQEIYQVLYLDMLDFRINFFYAQTAQHLHAIQLTLPHTVKPKPW